MDSCLKMPVYLKIIIGIALILANNCILSAQVSWTAEAYGGAVSNIRTPLKVSQEGYPDISINATYRSRSLERPIYYGWRIGRWDNGKSLELEFIHHKIYLENNPPEIQSFSVSHGLNMLMIGRGIQSTNFIFRYGAGIIISHPEFTVRNISYDQKQGIFNKGYKPNGVAFNASISYPFNLSERFFINTEFKSTFSLLTISQKNFDINTSNLAFHLILGAGYIVTPP